MAYSEFEQSFMDSVSGSYFQEPLPEPTQTAAGPTQIAAKATTSAAASVPEIKSYDPTMRERIASFLQAGFEGLGMERSNARKNAQSIIGGPSSGGPLGLGIADIVPFLGTALQTEEAGRSLGNAATLVQQGDITGAAIEGTMGAVGMIPGAAGTIKYGKQAINATKDLPSGLSIKPVGQIPTGAPAPNVVSTRLPTAKKATEDPIANKLVIDLPTMKADPNAFTENINLIREYPNFVSNAANTDQAAEDFIGQVKDNLLWLYDQVPDQTRNRSRLWYDGARNIVDQWGNEFSQPDQAISGVLAVLSPQKDWFMNVSLGNRVLDIALNKGSSGWDDAMEQTAGRIWAKEKYAPVLNLVRGKSYNELTSPAEKALWLRTYDETFNDRAHQIVTPEGTFAGVRLKMDGTPFGTGWGSLNEIGKAVAILENPSLENISLMLGQQHKVRNFYNNIYAPNDQAGHVTIDTHAVAAGLLRPLSGNSREVAHNFGSNIKGERGPVNSSVSGAQGTYGLYAEAYRRAAADRGVLPREMQSITWEAVRGLFPDRWKTEKNSQLIDNIWVEYRKGKISLEEARNEVIRTAGGINAPEWESAGLRGGAAGQSKNAVDQGQLSGSSLSGRSAERSRRNKSAAGNSTSVIGGQAAPAMGAE